MQSDKCCIFIRCNVSNSLNTPRLNFVCWIKALKLTAFRICISLYHVIIMTSNCKFVIKCTFKLFSHIRKYIHQRNKAQNERFFTNKENQEVPSHPTICISSLAILTHNDTPAHTCPQLRPQAVKMNDRSRIHYSDKQAITMETTT